MRDRVVRDEPERAQTFGARLRERARLDERRGLDREGPVDRAAVACEEELLALLGELGSSALCGAAFGALSKNHAALHSGA